jgi:NAD(P)-dependent dehydrogenase (short-subunit alcohol dehydrogenase family)
MAPSDDLKGQVVLVTGGSGGIGDAVLGELMARGAHGVSLDLVPSSRPGVQWHETDMRSDTSVQSAVEELHEQHGRIDVAVHAAGVSRDAVVWKLTAEDWDLVHAVNLRGAFLLMHHAVPCMRQGNGGRIVLIGSINGSRGKFGLSAYASSKAGLLGLCRSVARETARFGVRVNVVEPGMVRTPMIDALPDAVRQAAVGETLVGRLAEPDDVAHAVSFLCGPESRHVTGQILRVDGGQYL